MSEIYHSDRFFKVRQYTVSLRGLLLRGSRDGPPNTRIGVHFPGGGLMLVRHYCEGPAIRVASDEERARLTVPHSVEIKPADASRWVTACRAPLSRHSRNGVGDG